MSWRPAKSLTVLRDQINALYPLRNKASDGLLGDAAHAAGYSEHNPDANGVVRALDITHDPARGCDCQKIVDALVASRDPRILYIIWNYKIISATVSAWEWRPYRGANPHNHHFHLSVVASPSLYDKTSKWDLAGVPVAPENPEPAPKSRPILRKGSVGEDVKYLQTKLGGLTVDGDFGPKTHAAVLAFQKAQGLVQDGAVGQYSWRALEA